MAEIIPAILPKSFEELEAGLQFLKGIAPLVQIDLVGQNVLQDREAPPLWEEFDFEFDIMLPNPAGEVVRCIELGASRIVVHAHSVNALEAVQFLQQYRGGAYPVEVGVAIASHGELELLQRFGGLYDYAQVMGIAHIGKQGEPFDERALETIKELRAANPTLVIQVDGAAATHPQELAEAGADRLVVGSAIINAADPKETLLSLYNKANVGQ
jgi:pentose-5-phosphate-3-epimerase